MDIKPRRYNNLLDQTIWRCDFKSKLFQGKGTRDSGRDIDTIEALLDHDAAVNDADAVGQTPLYFAVKVKGQLQILRALLSSPRIEVDVCLIISVGHFVNLELVNQIYMAPWRRI